MEIQTEIKVVRFIEFDGLRFYPDKRGYWLARKKDWSKPKRLHVYVWEYYNGPIPGGYHVHHKDHNPDNNEIENLELISKHDHLKYHADQQDKDWARNNLLEKAIPAAKAWHSSPEGIAWHSKHGKEITEKTMAETVEKVCQHCGKPYLIPRVLSGNSRFCSNNCKSAWRRKAGIDDMEVACEMCGAKFFTNKYARKRFCSESCRRKSSRQKWDVIMAERAKAKNLVSDTDIT